MVLCELVSYRLAPNHEEKKPLVWKMLAHIKKVVKDADPSTITELSLDGCTCSKIEGLSDFPHLKSLYLNNAGITSLEGLPEMPQLEELELSDNKLSGGLELIKAPKLKKLRLANNKLPNFESVKCLAHFKHLSSLDLMLNPMSQDTEYREAIFEMIPSLKFLDGCDINNEEDEESNDESSCESDEEEEEVDDDDEGENEVGLEYLQKDEISNDEGDDDYHSSETESDGDSEEENLSDLEESGDIEVLKSHEKSYDLDQSRSKKRSIADSEELSPHGRDIDGSKRERK